MISLKTNIPDDALMRMVAQSDAIVRGKIVTGLPTENIEPNKYLELVVSPIEVLKGTDVPNLIPLKYFVRDPLAVIPNQPCLYFLTDLRHDPYNKCYFLVSESTIIGSGFFGDEPDLVRRVKSEIQIQRENVEHFAQITTALTPLEQKVKTLIEDMLDARKATMAYKKLEELGIEAVPAIIHNMNDMRDLPVKHIQLENKSSQAWEAIRHYGPQKVIDVLAAILNQITGAIFGEIHNGGVDKERVKAYHGWINWLSTQQKKDSRENIKTKSRSNERKK